MGCASAEIRLECFSVILTALGAARGLISSATEAAVVLSTLMVRGLHVWRHHGRLGPTTKIAVAILRSALLTSVAKTATTGKGRHTGVSLVHILLLRVAVVVRHALTPRRRRVTH